MANMMQLATDDNNPEFVGARNPDDVLFVRFYMRPLQDNFQTEAQGRPIFNDVIFIEIQTPGNQLNIIDRPKYAKDEIRFPRQWAYFKNTHSNDPSKQGTPFAQWPLMTVSQVEMLKAHKFHFIEQFANGSDEQIKSVGMSLGMDPHAFRERCRNYLVVARDSNSAMKKEEELAKRDAEISELKAAIAELQQTVKTQKAKKKYVMTPAHKAAIKKAREDKAAAKG